MAKKSKGKNQQRLKSNITQAAKSDEFNPDYSDVIKDLKRIGVLAGIFFAILVGLSLFIG